MYVFSEESNIEETQLENLDNIDQKLVITSILFMLSIIAPLAFLFE